MKIYYIGTNNYYHTASVILEQVPIVLHCLEIVVQNICSIIPGDALQHLFHLKICEKCTHLRTRYTKFINIPLPYHYLKDLFPERFRQENYEFDDDDVEFTNKTKEIDKKATIEFKLLQERMSIDTIKVLTKL